MSVESFVHAMPKVELHVHLEGAIHKERLLIIAEQNEIAEANKRFQSWVDLLDNPDYDHLTELVTTTMTWLEHPDDLTHVTYELGVALAKQNIRYAEVSVNPINFTEHGWTFDQFLSALNDGRDRAERGWGVQMRWNLTVERDQPRHADEIVRWASSATAQNGGVVGVNLNGSERVQPVGQFERAFRTAAKKHIPTAVHAGAQMGLEGIREALEHLEPARIIDGWGLAESPDVQEMLIENQIALEISQKRARSHGWVEADTEYPLRQLVDAGLTIILGSDMPTYYHSNLNDEYLAAVQQGGLSVDELEAIALNAVECSQQSPQDKAAMIDAFKQAYEQLREEHLDEEVT
ncbi:MAG: hypothetical protein CL610_09500 [Anaerolineaceae bacterium]|nr:hypothetical protein [Anaerolineaceae bacterium]